MPSMGKKRRTLCQLDFSAYEVSFAFSLTVFTHFQSYLDKQPFPQPSLVRLFHALLI